jgi:Tol biopolymer transport system component
MKRAGVFVVVWGLVGLIAASLSGARVARLAAGRPAGLLVFVGLPPGVAVGQLEIFSIRPDGSHLRRLTHTDAGEEGPIGSPDGRRIAFTVPAVGIGVMNANGSGYRIIDHKADGGQGADQVAAWSPDSKHLAFMSYRDGTAWRVFTMNADGTRQRRLAYAPALANGASWSRDGTKLLLSAGGGLFIIGAREGRVLRQIGLGKIQNAHGATWSPDNRRITFFRNRQDFQETQVLYIATSSGKLVRHMDFPAPTLTWAPDSRSLVFSHNYGFTRLFVATGRTTRILTRGVVPSSPSWLGGH